MTQPLKKTPVSGRWTAALAGHSESFHELAGTYWYPIYAWWRRGGLQSELADAATVACLTRWLSAPPPTRSPDNPDRLRQWLPRQLAKLAASGIEPTDCPAIETDLAHAEYRYAQEPAGSADTIFQRRWALTVLEVSLGTLRQEYQGQEDLFHQLFPFLQSRSAMELEQTAEAAGLQPHVFKAAVEHIRERHRELLRGFITDTIADPGELQSEVMALLVAVESAGPASESHPCPSALGGIAPAELLAGALNQVRQGESPIEPEEEDSELAAEINAAIDAALDPSAEPPAIDAPPKRTRALIPISIAGAAILLWIGGNLFFNRPQEKVTAEQRAEPTPAGAPVEEATPVAPPADQTALETGEVERMIASLAAMPIKQTIDLLALVDPLQDRISPGKAGPANEWVKNNSGLHFKSDGKVGLVAAPVAINARKYQLELKFKRLDGPGMLHLDLPLPGNLIVPLFLDRPTRRLINGTSGPTWPTTRPGPARVRIYVERGTGWEPDHLLVFLGEEPVPFGWQGRLQNFAKPALPHPSFPDQALPSLLIPKDPYEVTGWKLVVFEGEAKILRQPALAIAPPAPAQPPTPTPVPLTPTAQWLKEQEPVWQTAFHAQVKAPFEKALAELKKPYLALLDAQLAIANRSNATESVTALLGEKDRLDGDNPLGAEDELKTIPQLSLSRFNFRVAAAKLDSERYERAKAFHAQIDAALGQNFNGLTERLRMREAEELRIAREALRTAWLQPPMTAPVPPQILPAVSTPKPLMGHAMAPPPPKLKPRDLAERLLALGAQVGIQQAGLAKPLTDPADIPTEKFTVAQLELANRDGMSEADLDILEQLADATSITLKEVPATDATIEKLRHCLNLDSLTLTSLEKLTAASFRTIAALPALKTLFLTLDSISPESLSALSKSRRLETLEILVPALSESDFTALGSISTLKTLEVSVPELPPNAWAPLTQLRALTRLNVLRHPLKAEAIAQISRINNLEALTLGILSVTDLELLPLGNLKLLQELRITNAESFDGSAFAKWPIHNSVKILALNRRQSTSDSGLQAIVSAFPKLNQLQLFATKGAVTPSGLAHLSKLRHLSNLTFNGDALDDDALAHLVKCDQMEQLALDDAHLTDRNIALLAKLSALRIFAINDPPISEHALKTYSKLRSLTRFGIGLETPAENEHKLRTALPKVKIVRQ